MSRILIVGATGQQGGSVRAALAGRGHDLVALVRSTEDEKAQALAQSGVELVVGDLADKDSLAKAFVGIDAAFAVTTPFESGTDVETRHGVNIAEAAAEAGLPYLVYSSVASADEDTGIAHFDSKFAVERRIAELGLRAAIVAPVFFMENFLFPWNVPAYLAGKVRQPLPPEVALQLVSSVDIGKAVADVIERPEDFAGRRVELVGDEVTGSQMAEVLSAATGRSLSFEVQPMAEVASMGADMADMYEWFAAVGYSADNEVLARDLPSVRLQTFAEWASAQDWDQVLSQ